MDSKWTPSALQVISKRTSKTAPNVNKASGVLPKQLSFATVLRDPMRFIVDGIDRSRLAYKYNKTYRDAEIWGIHVYSYADIRYADRKT